MDADEILDRGSPGPASSSNKRMRPPSKVRQRLSTNFISCILYGYARNPIKIGTLSCACMFLCCSFINHIFVFSLYHFQALRLTPIYQSNIYVFSIPFPNTQVDYTIVKIFGRMILDIMLDHLGIPRAIYRTRMYSQNTMTITVLFYWRKMYAFEYFC